MAFPSFPIPIVRCATVNKYSPVWKPPQGRLSLFENNMYFILQWEINLDAVIQTKAQRLWSVTGSPGFFQAWVWTRAAWFNLISDKKQQAFGTPLRSTSTPHNIISSSTQGVRSTVAVRGEICFHFTTSVAEKTIQMLLYFPYYCSIVWIPLLSLLLLSVFPQYTHSRGSLVTASHYYPETAAQQRCSANVPSDTTHIPTLPRRVMCVAKRIWYQAQFSISVISKRKM